MQTINERFVKLSSQIPYSEDIQLGQDVDVAINGHRFIANCVKTEDRDQQDGTINKVYVLKFLSE